MLSVNYRLGIGYGHAFNQPEHAGPTGASEYQDVVAGANFLQSVSPASIRTRIGIWGGSYGGYLTAMGLARNSDIFKAGVDLSRRARLVDVARFAIWQGSGASVTKKAIANRR